MLPHIIAASIVSYLIFHKYEPQGLTALSILVVSVPVGLSILLFEGDYLAIPAAFFYYWGLILVYTVLYRLSPFHPLAKFPGPVLHRISKIAVVLRTRRGDLHRYYKTLLDTYGDIVRVGPNEVIYRNVDGVAIALGPTGLQKGPYHDNRAAPGLSPSIPFLRDPVEHAKRRRFFNRAFSGPSVKDYEEIIIKRCHELVAAFEQRTSEVVDIAKWMGFFSYDVMGDMAFSFSFDMMKMGEDRSGYLEAVHSLVEMAGLFSHTNWFMGFVRRLSTSPSIVLMDNLSKKMVEQRLESGSVKRDLMYHLTNENGKDSDPLSSLQIKSDGESAIIAGSDTTGTVLANVWYFLMKNPVFYARLRQEVDVTFPDAEEPVDVQKLSEMPYLHACLNEAMRLLPVVPGGSQRAVLPGTGGKMFGSHFIPEGSTIYVHTYSLHRDPRYFSPYPESFWPDRWLEPADRRLLEDVSKHLNEDVPFVLDQKAFIPFSHGPRNCVGRLFALAELRVAVAFIIQKFDMKIAPGCDFSGWEEGLQDYFIYVKTGSLPVVLTERSR